jgi:Leucine-rich repeat (LRR) protein
MTEILINMNPIEGSNSIEEIKKQAEKNIKRVLLQYIKREITDLPVELYNSEFLIDIDFSASQLKDLPELLFKNGHSVLNSINFSNNNIRILPVNLLKELVNLKILNFSENKIKTIPNDFLSNNKALTYINFSGNSLKEIPLELLKNAPELQTVNFSSNSLKSIPKDIFSNNFKLLVIDFSNNKIAELSNDPISKLSELKSIDLSFNEIKEIPNNFFDGLKELKTIDFSNNKIKDIQTDLLNDLYLLQYIDFSCNKIVNLSRYLFLDKSFLVDFRNNIDTNDLSILYDLLFDSYTKFSISSNLYNNYYIFKNDLNQLDFNQFLNMKNKYDNSIFLCRKINSKVFISNLLSLFLNKTCYHSSLVTGISNGSEDLAIDPLKTYDYKKKRIEQFEWSILDYFIFLSDLTSDVVIYFKNLIDSSLLQNPSLMNLEFKFKTTESIAGICQRDDILLFEAFFPANNFKKFLNDFKSDDSVIIVEQDEHKILRYLDNNDFFLSINYCECFEIALSNENEKIAIHLLLLMKYTILVSLLIDKTDDFDLNEMKFKHILDFNKKFLKDYLVKIFNLEWYELIEFILDNSNDQLFIYLLEEQLFLKTKPKNKNKNKISPSIIDNLKEKEVDENNEHNILMLICRSKRSNLLRHETTGNLLDTKWKYMPRIIYYTQLFIYVIFLAFYSTNIELYQKDDQVIMQNASKYISIIIIIYLIILEIIQIMDSIISNNLLTYLLSFRNQLLIINLPLSLTVLFLNMGETKASLYSLTILLSYFIFIQRLDKFYGIGPYVNVFGDVIQKSLKLIVIIFICLIGFLLSFRNRANYSTKVSNTIPYFNSSFELDIFKILTMVIGNDGTDNMGLDNMVPENIINYLIYLCFIFLIPILFINIFTGIAINAIDDLIENSEANIVMTKIEYIFKWDAIIKKTHHKWFYFVLQILLKVILKLKKVVIFFENISISSTRFLKGETNYLARTYANYKKNKFTNEKLDNKNQIEELDKKINNVLHELNKMSMMNQNRFEYLENKMELNNCDDKLDDLFLKIDEISKKFK